MVGSSRDRDHGWIVAVCRGCESFSQMVSNVRAGAEAAGVECPCGITQRASRVFWLASAVNLSLVLLPIVETNMYRPCHLLVGVVVGSTAVLALAGSQQRLLGTAHRITAQGRE